MIKQSVKGRPVNETFLVDELDYQEDVVVEDSSEKLEDVSSEEVERYSA